MRLAALMLAFAEIMGAQTWNSLVDRYFNDVYFRYNPSQATSTGFHQFDSALEDYSQTAIHQQLAALSRFEQEINAFSAAPEIDKSLLLANIHATRLALESIRMWEKNPDLYSSGVSSSAFAIMSRKFAAPDARLASLIAREKQMPKTFADARANLKNPPRIYTEVALEQLPGIIGFFETDVPAAFKDVTSRSLLDEFQEANQAVISALDSYQTWLRGDLLPRSRGEFRIGADNYRNKLAYEDMVDIPLDRLLGIGYADLRRNQQAFRETAKKIDSSKTPHQILAQSEENHPPPDKLLQAFRDTLQGLRTYIVQHRIAGIPSPVLPVVEETPPFARALTFASLDMPGPYEQVAKEAYFNVTLPEKRWTPQAIAEHMAAFNQGVIISTAVHEAYPGHYLQGMWLDRAPSKTMKLIGANTYIEGWAHYCEQMMLDEGYGNGDLTLRLGQLQDALLRNARFIVGIQMHTGKMTYEQGVDFFVKEGFQTRTNGERETKRGTSDPTYLYYTLGKLEILKLRDDYKKLKGSSFQLEDFHDRFLSQGAPPIKVVRRIMLGNETPVL